MSSTSCCPKFNDWNTPKYQSSFTLSCLGCDMVCAKVYSCIPPRIQGKRSCSNFADVTQHLSHSGRIKADFQVCGIPGYEILQSLSCLRAKLTMKMISDLFPMPLLQAG